MKRLWIADVHANLPAFEAVLDDVGGVDEIVFLGDIVGFGPYPSECLDLLQRLQPRAVLGNHDATILAMRGRPAAPSRPVVWDEWTCRQLSDSQCAYLAGFPDELQVVSAGMDIKAIHHPRGIPYLHPAMPDNVLANHFRDVAGPAVFCGHSHRPIDRTVAGRRFVCIPAVGQPRNGDARAGYAVEQNGVLHFRFVAYDIERVVIAVRKIGLAEGFCLRWCRFLRTAFDVEWSREYVETRHIGAPPH